MTLHLPGPDALSSEQAEDAINVRRPVRWWVPAMWLYVLSMTLLAFGVWTWVDAESDLHLASSPTLTSGFGTITRIDTPRITRSGGIFSLRYEFEIGSLTYAGTRVSPYDALTAANAQSIRQYLTPGATVPIKYLGANPDKSFIDAAAWCNLAAEEATTRQSRVIGILLVIAAVAAFVAAAWTFVTAQARRQREDDFQFPS